MHSRAAAWSGLNPVGMRSGLSGRMLGGSNAECRFRLIRKAAHYLSLYRSAKLSRFTKVTTLGSKSFLVRCRGVHYSQPITVVPPRKSTEVSGVERCALFFNTSGSRAWRSIGGQGNRTLPLM